MFPFPYAAGAGPDQPLSLPNMGDTFTFIERPALQSPRMTMQGKPTEEQ